MPSAMLNSASTAGADVKVIASIPELQTAAMRRRTRSESSWTVQR